MLQIKPWQKFEKAAVSEQEKILPTSETERGQLPKSLIPTFLIEHLLQFDV